MPGIASAELIADLEGAVQGGSSARRVQMLRQVTDLFLSGGDRLNQQQIEVFDDVLVRLIERIEARALTQLSTTLADVAAAPREAVRRLAFHEEANVATPVLLKSECLTEGDLIEIANSRGQEHLLAISGRKTLNENVTDVLLERGGADVHRVLAKNDGAHFSEQGFSTLAATAENDESIAESLGLRLDIPINILRALIAKATDAVRLRLVTHARPEMRAKIEAAIELVAGKIGVQPQAPVDYVKAQSLVLELNKAGKLNDSAINRFAIRRQQDNVVAALSLLSTVTVEAIKPLMDEPGCNGLIVACRAAGLTWQTTLAVINNRTGAIAALSPQDVEQFKTVFDGLSLSSAQRTIRFWSARASATKLA
jgi:uncharacterized protein (DUF2336 family)